MGKDASRKQARVRRRVANVLRQVMFLCFSSGTSQASLTGWISSLDGNYYLLKPMNTPDIAPRGGPDGRPWPISEWELVDTDDKLVHSDRCWSPTWASWTHHGYSDCTTEWARRFEPNLFFARLKQKQPESRPIFGPEGWVWSYSEWELVNSGEIRKSDMCWSIEDQRWTDHGWGGYTIEQVKGCDKDVFFARLKTKQESTMRTSTPLKKPITVTIPDAERLVWMWEVNKIATEQDLKDLGVRMSYRTMRDSFVTNQIINGLEQNNINPTTWTPDEPITVGGHTAEFKNDGVQIGCTFVPRNTVLAIARKLEQE